MLSRDLLKQILEAPNVTADCHDPETCDYMMVDEMLLVGVAIFCADISCSESGDHPLYLPAQW